MTPQPPVSPVVELSEEVREAIGRAAGYMAVAVEPAEERSVLTNLAREVRASALREAAQVARETWKPFGDAQYRTHCEVIAKAIEEGR